MRYIISISTFNRNDRRATANDRGIFFLPFLFLFLSLLVYSICAAAHHILCARGIFKPHVRWNDFTFWFFFFLFSSLSWNINSLFLLSRFCRHSMWSTTCRLIVWRWMQSCSFCSPVVSQSRRRLCATQSLLTRILWFNEFLWLLIEWRRWWWLRPRRICYSSIQWFWITEKFSFGFFE